MTLLTIWMLAACSAPETQTSANGVGSTWSNRYTAFLSDLGLSLIEPYEISGDDPPVFFGHVSGWSQISMPSHELLVSMSSKALYSCSCDHDVCGHCVGGHDPMFPDPEGDNNGPCTYITCCSAEQCMPVPDENAMPPPVSCPSGPPYTGVWCGADWTVGMAAECCGWCGCDEVGCQFTCEDTDDCPENEHPPFPYYSP